MTARPSKPRWPTGTSFSTPAALRSPEPNDNDVVDELPSCESDGSRSALDPLAELSRRMAEAIRSATMSGPVRVSSPDLLVRYAEQVSAIPRLWAQPLRRIVEE